MNQSVASRSGENIISAGRLLLALVLAALLAGCAFSRMEFEVLALADYGVMSGTVPSSAPPGRTQVAAYRDERDEQVAVETQAVTSRGRFTFVLPRAGYSLVAFDDRDGDGVYDPGEAIGSLRVDQGDFERRQPMLDLRIDAAASGSASTNAPDGPTALRSPVKSDSNLELGAVVDLDDARFSAAYGVKGLWEPLTFVKDVRGGLFFLEPYTPAKIPVLFVHGAGGSPQDWRYFFEHLDRTRFQPWFYYYPSALPLDESAFWLNKAVEMLHARFPFQRMVVTAHSMGGLVATRFIDINRKARNPAPVSVFISISTPWAGVGMAQLGVDYAPAIIPSWLDVAPASDFLSEMQKNSLPSNLDYYLFYGCGCTDRQPTSGFDGVVSVESQLEVWASRQADGVFGFDASHDRILESPSVLARYRDVLGRWWIRSGQEDGMARADRGFAPGGARSSRLLAASR